LYQPDLLLLKCAKNSVRYLTGTSGPRRISTEEWSVQIASELTAGKQIAFQEKP
jgi:hypothetical protein